MRAKNPGSIGRDFRGPTRVSRTHTHLERRRADRRQWFFRWTVATGTSLALGVPWVLTGVAEIAAQLGESESTMAYLAAYANLATLLVPPLTLAIFVYHLMTGRPARQNGVRCWRCGYMLRGLTVPRCPECGTPY